MTKLIPLVCLLPVLVAFGCSKSDSPATLRPKTLNKLDSCEEWRKSLPDTFAQGFVTVPEEPGNAASPSIQVYYYYRMPLHGRITLFLNGGPGGSSHSSAELMEETIKTDGLRDKMTFVYMDQRGTGCSSPYPSASTDAEMFERGKWYGSRGIVSDAEAIRETLVGSAPWSIFGQSYGAWIAHRYAVMAPQSLDRVIAYANTITPNARLRQSNRMASQIDIWKAYFKVFPDDQTKIQILIQALNDNVCVKFDEYEQCGVDLISPLPSYYLAFHDEWPKMNKWISRLVVGGVIQMPAIDQFAHYFSESSNLAAQRATSAINYWDRDVTPGNETSCLDAQSDWEVANPGLKFTDSLTECSGALQEHWNSKSYDRVATHFGGQKDPLTFNELHVVLATRPKNFFYLYSGDLDPLVPSRSFGPEIEALGDVLTYRNYSDVGHDGFYTKREVLDDLLAP